MLAGSEKQPLVSLVCVIIMMVLRKLRETTRDREAATFLIRSSRGSHEFDSASITAVAISTALVQHPFLYTARSYFSQLTHTRTILMYSEENTNYW